MSEQHDPFFPHRVDESIEQLASTKQSDGVSREGEHLEPSERLVRDLQQLYSPEHERYRRALQRVEGRLVEQHIVRDKSPMTAPVWPGQEQRAPASREIQGRLHTMEHTSSTNSRMTRFGRRASMLVAVLVVAVLVGSLIAVLNLTHRSTTTGHGADVTPTSTSDSSFGRTLYTKSSQSGFSDLAWSFDSKRVASITDKVQIWDATTGKNLVTVPLPTNAFVGTLAWSPVSQLVAIATTQGLLVVNGQTGAIVYTYTYSAGLASVNTPAGGTSLSARVPASGGPPPGPPVWSPDGKLIAVTDFTDNRIVVWNPRTNTVVFEITGSTSGAAIIDAGRNAASGGPIPGTQYISVDAWSPDGQYLAGTMYETSCETCTLTGYVAVWKVSTRQIVFKVPFNSNGSVIGPIWQPHSDNLAFAQLLSKTPSPSTLEIWNVLTRTQVKHYAIAVAGPMTWSPDGKYLAYEGNNTGSWVIIIDASSGQPVYTYKGHKLYVASLAWSPNGKYIVSGEGDTHGNMVAKVWTAE